MEETTIKNVSKGKFDALNEQLTGKATELFENLVNYYFETVNAVQALLKTSSIEDFIKLYCDKLFLVDTLYRKMYY